jgi:malonyl-CoA O-methyltransferase
MYCIEQVKQSFSSAVDTYDQVAILQKDSAKSVAQLLQKNFLNQNDQHHNFVQMPIVDVGCGTGALVREILNQESRLSLADWSMLDISEALLQKAVDENNMIQPNLHIDDMDAFEWPKNHYQAIVSNYALQWSQNLSALFKKMHRAMTASGCFIFSMPVVGSLWQVRSVYESIGAEVPIHDFYSIDDIETFLMNAGFDICFKQAVKAQTHFQTFSDVLRSLKAMGVKHCRADRSMGLKTPKHWQRLNQAAFKYQEAQGFPLSFVEGHFVARPRGFLHAE